MNTKILLLFAGITLAGVSSALAQRVEYSAEAATPQAAPAQTTTSRSQGSSGGKSGARTNTFGEKNNFGCQMVYYGSWDNVDTPSGQKDIGASALTMDGRVQGTCYVEFLISKGGGFQRFRYESDMSGLNPENISRVNPLDSRGADESDITQKKAAIQKLSADIAPFDRWPNFLLWFRDEFFGTHVGIQSSYASQLNYYPYASDKSVQALTKGNVYWLDVHLEEILYSWDTHVPFTKHPVRFAFFDMVYQKPVMIKNIDTAPRPYDLYHPRFLSNGLLFKVSEIPTPMNKWLTIDISYGFSLAGVMRLGPNRSLYNPLPSNLPVDLQRVQLGLVWDWGQGNYLSYRGEYMWIKLNEASQPNSLISLDAMNYLSWVVKF